jgi:RND superfamily putative drug exporter
LGRTDRFFSALGRASVRLRWIVIAAWVAAAVVTTVALPSMGSEVNNDNSQFLPPSSSSLKAATLAAPLLGTVTNESPVLVVAAVRTGGLSAADAGSLMALAGEVAALEGVRSVKLAGVSADRAAAELQVEVAAGQANVAAQKPVVGSIGKALASFNASLAARNLGLQAHLAGAVATNVANQSSADKASREVQDVSLVFIVLLLVLIFRSLLAPLITLAPAGAALAVSMRLIGALGMHGLKISEITELLLIVLLLGAGTDYGLFLVYRTREEIKAGLAAKEAVAHAIARVGESVSASAATVVFALLSLLLASFGIYHDLGIPLAIGVAVMLLAGLTLLPALLAVFGRGAFWPSRVMGRPGVSGDGSSWRSHADGWWGAVAQRLLQRPARTLAVGLVVFVALSLAALGYYSSGFGGALSAPKGSDAAIGNALLARHFPEVSANPANIVFRYKEPVWSDAAPLVKAGAVLEASHLFSRIVGPLDPNGTPLSAGELERLHALLGPPAALQLPEPGPLAARAPPAEYNAYRSLVPLVSSDGRTVEWLAELVAGPQGSTAAMDATPKVRRAVEAAAAVSGAAASGLAGEAASLYDVSSASGHDITEIIPVAIAAIGVLLALVLRSLVAPLYLIVSVGLSYLAALGVSTIAFIDIGGSRGITFILPFLMFIFLLALGEDYNILVMTRIREEARRAPLREAVVRAIGRTGPTVTSAGMVLAGTFAVLAFEAGSGPGAGQVRDVGFGLATGVLMDTFLVRTLLVPSAVALLGRANWWPGRLQGPQAAQAALVAEAEPAPAGLAEG